MCFICKDEWTVNNLPEYMQYGIGKIPNVWGGDNCINALTFPSKMKYTETTHYMYSVQPNPSIQTWTISYSKESREKLIRNLETVRQIFDTCCYIPVVNVVSGLIRVIGASVIAYKVDQLIAADTIKGAYQVEAYWTTRGHILRGILELIPVVGMLMNLALDWSYSSWPMADTCYRGRYTPGDECVG